MSTSVQSMWNRYFAEHPAAVRESYLEHFLAASKIGLQLLSMAFACLCHALVPGLFETSASRGILRLAGDISRRRCCYSEGGSGI